jgi:hypothetical protein
MKGVITVGSGGGSGPTTTAASGAGSNVALVTTPKAAVPWSAGKPAIYWAGWGLFAVGALLALMLIALYALHPRLQPPEAPRGGGRIAGLSLPAGVAASSLTTIEASLGLLKIIAGGRCARSAHRPTIATPSRAWPRRGPPVTRR